MKITFWIIVLLVMGQPLARAQGKATNTFSHGKLSNGLTYYVCHTSWKPGFADFYLVQNVGALMEDENQNGLAHVLEHMAFNSTENFPEGVQYFLKRRGIEQFNAYTGQDETVYNINQVPTKEISLVDSCLYVLRDWSGFLSLLPEQIEKEKNVILEERRATRDVGQRIREQSDQYIYNHSKYATHNVIGTLDVLNNFTREELSRYYKDFYRPDQQAIIIVGDVDVQHVIQKIEQLMGSIPERKNPKPRLIYEIPDNQEPLYSAATDPEVPSTTITLMKRIKVKSYSSAEEMMRDNILRSFYNKLVARRLSAYVNQENPAFTGTSVNYGSLVRGYDAFNIVVKPIAGEDEQALREVLRQVEIIHQLGFTEEELQEEIKLYQHNLDETERVKDKMSNDVYVKICQNNFLKGKPLVTVQEDIAVSRRIVEKLTLNELNAWMSSWNKDDKNWIFLLAGKDPNDHYPTLYEISNLMQEVRQEKLAKRDYKLEAVPLLDFEVQGGHIVKTKELKDLGAELWTLDNGCRVYYKYTDEHVNLNLLGESYGGKSILPAEDLPSAEALSSLALRSGLYHHSSLMMREILKGHRTSVNFRLGETNESVSGATSVEDAEIMFQIIYLLFEKPKFDREDFDKFVNLSKMESRNAKGNVKDSIGRLVQNKRMIESPRRWQVNEQFFDAMDYDKMISIYKDRFQDASDFTFYLVGGLPKEQAKAMVEQYLGAIPSIYRKEHYQIYDFRTKGSFACDIEAAIPDEKYIVNIEFHENMKFSDKDGLCLDMLSQILQERCNREIREGQGGTYGVEVVSSNSTFPVYEQFFGISFQSSLEKGADMRALVHKEVEKLGTNPIDDDEVNDFMLQIKQGQEKHLQNKNNSFWMDALRIYTDEGKVITDPRYFEKKIGKVSGKDLQAVARKFFKQADCFDIVIKSKK